MQILLIDGYIDEPGCLGVPPYLAPLPRYIYGALRQELNLYPEEIVYKPIDQLRNEMKFANKQLKRSELLRVLII